MRDGYILRIERNVARCRLLLSLTAPLAVYVDPTEPILVRFLHIRSGAFDGVGFPRDATPPWSIASRAAEVGGRVWIRDDESLGAHVVSELPT